MNTSTNDTEYKELFLRQFYQKVRRVRREEDELLNKLRSLESEKEQIINLANDYSIDDSKEPDLHYYLSKKTEDDKKLDRLIRFANDYIALEYAKSKYEGRELSSLFRGFVSLIGADALAKFDISN